MRIIRVCGVDIQINSFLCIVFIICFLFGYTENIVISFIVVLLHEGVHVFVARLLGYNIENIEVFPFGGVARIKENIAINPLHEILIAAAGPIFNLVVVFVIYNSMKILCIAHEGLSSFMYANLTIGLFNLVPIIPLDGGRIIRAYLAYFIGFKRAIKIVVIISKIMSVIFFLWGCYVAKYNKINIFVLLLSIFIFIAAHKEYKTAAFVFMKEISQKKEYLLYNGVLKTKNLVAIQTSFAKDVMDQFIPRKYHIITVLDKECNIVGVLTENDVFNGIVKYGMNVSLEKLLMSK